MVAAFRSLGFAVSARVILVLAIMGAFALALIAMNGSLSQLGVLVAYCLLVVLPVVYLEVRKGR